MARPRKTKDNDKQETETTTSNEIIQEMNKKIKLLEQEREQLNRKLEKRNQFAANTNTAQYLADSKGISEMRQEDAKKVKGVFRCFSPPGGNVEFYFRKYKGDPIEKYTLNDGETYELPLGVVKHLNENCYEEDKAFLLDANGDKIRGAGKKNFRFSFTPSEYGSPMRQDVQPAANNA